MQNATIDSKVDNPLWKVGRSGVTIQANVTFLPDSRANVFASSLLAIDVRGEMTCRSQAKREVVHAVLQHSYDMLRMLGRLYLNW